jgi:hypothetical protein
VGATSVLAAFCASQRVQCPPRLDANGTTSGCLASLAGGRRSLAQSRHETAVAAPERRLIGNFLDHAAGVDRFRRIALVEELGTGPIGALLQRESSKADTLQQGMRIQRGCAVRQRRSPGQSIQTCAVCSVVGMATEEPSERVSILAR